LGDVVGAYKSLVAVNWLRWIKANDRDRSGRVWQRNYYERVIRNDAELNRVREYIAENPMKWQFDSDNPARVLDEGYEKRWAWLESGG
jgi:hypothetical protein